MNFGFHVATDRCYGCKTCSVACANEHLLTPGVLLRRVRQIDYSNPVGQAFVSMSCNHCDDPVCVANCPVGAYSKQEDTGLVVQDHSLCIGCQTCVNACPFHAPSYNEEDSTTYKCDGCLARREKGLPPVCTTACPSANISVDDFGKLENAYPNGKTVKNVVDTKPNLALTLDSDLSIEVFVAIDEAPGIVDRGLESA